MRVLHLSWEYPPVVHGGLGRHVDALTRAQAAAGDEVGVVCLADDLTAGHRAQPQAPALEVRDGVWVRRVRAPVVADPVADLASSMAVVQQRMRSTAAGLAADVVHAHDWMVADAARAVADDLGCPMVLTVHATELGRREGRLDGPVPQAVHEAECRAVVAADRVVVCSTPMVDEVVEHGAERSAVCVVPGAVEGSRWCTSPAQRGSARARFGAKGPLVVAAGRLEWEKGFSTLLRAMPAVLAAHPACSVVLAGTGSYEPQLRALAGDLGLDGSLELPGRLGTPDLAGLFAAADVVVVPSRYEPFGLVALEAQAAGAAVVATAVGGLGEIVEDGRTGRLFAPGDVDRLAAILTVLLGDPAGVAGLAAGGTAKARQRTWAGVADALRFVYPDAPG
ncbi:glycosyltransferase family 4 protein [Angustibacter sp. McL0619]|uniref:glycosyltransferase family 4 protein n=1 Tax=Angustibacter sp. McL0619 TaxID=3415676 RepID=UPI003CF5CE40